MNQIKFRAYRPSDKSMMPSNSLEEILRLAAGLGVPYSIDEIIWLQFTGLQDKNGVDIHEGDIVQYKEREEEGVAEITTFGNSSNLFFRWITQKTNSHTIADSIHYFGFAGALQIIGNIHQNPELIK
jgi:uncharacterized phage protein (TIGR01671 family)